MKKTTLERLKVVARGVFFHILTLKCASHHNAVHFFDISTSKSGPSQFLTRLTSKCVSRIFAPQRRALYRHDNFQRCSEAKALLAFWLWNVFRAIAASTFSTSVIPKLLRTSCVLYVLTSTWRPLFRHLNFQKCSDAEVLWPRLLPNRFATTARFLISHLTRCLHTRRFSEPIFRASGPTKHWKTTLSRDFSTFCAFSSSFLLLFLFWLFLCSHHCCCACP